MGHEGNAYTDTIWKPETDHLEDLGLHGRTILKWILKEKDGRVKSAFFWLGTGTW